MASDHGAILRAAAGRFHEERGRWPRSMDELDPFGVRGFGTSPVVGFADASEDELCLRFTHRGGNGMVKLRRPSDAG